MQQIKHGFSVMINLRKKIAKKLNRPGDSKGHGGDRKSDEYQGV